jgi:aspartyl-tRNA(Asn)/glutamyl-tRNA(Gln) amidotransferase subunit C
MVECYLRNFGSVLYKGVIEYRGGIIMKITREQVEHVANLARLNLTEEEKEQMTTDLEAIIDFADKINGFEIDDTNPTAHIIPINNVFRKDEVKPSYNRDELLKNAPNKEDGCFSVPRIVE